MDQRLWCIIYKPSIYFLNIKIEDYLNDNIIVEDENVFNKLSSLEYIKKNFYKFEIIICDGMDVSYVEHLHIHRVHRHTSHMHYCYHI